MKNCSDWPHTLKSELVTKGDAHKNTLTHKDPQLHNFLFFFFFYQLWEDSRKDVLTQSPSVVKKILHRKWNVSPTCKTVPLSVSLCRAKGRPKAHDAPRLHTTDPQSLSWAACTLVCLFVCFDGDHADKWCDVHLTFFCCFPLLTDNKELHSVFELLNFFLTLILPALLSRAPLIKGWLGLLCPSGKIQKKRAFLKKSAD